MSHADAETVFADNPGTNAAWWDGVQWTPYPDPIRPPETDEEPWSVSYLAVGSEADRPAILVIPPSSSPSQPSLWAASVPDQTSPSCRCPSRRLPCASRQSSEGSPMTACTNRPGYLPKFGSEPAAPMRNSPDGVVRHAVATRQSQLRLAIGQGLANRGHLSLGELRRRVALAGKAVGSDAFRGSVRPVSSARLNETALSGFARIVRVGAEVEVSRVHAGRVVALMEHVEACRDRSVLDLPCDAVSGPNGGPANTEATVSAPVAMRLPKPASVRSKNVAPEPLWHRDVRWHTPHFSAANEGR
jgi:hypothetical protein